jgi:hypothetical protein
VPSDAILLLLVAGAVFFTLSHWYVNALLRAAKLRIRIARVAAAAILWLGASVSLTLPMGWAVWRVVSTDADVARRGRTCAEMALLYGCCLIPAGVRFSRRKQELRAAGYKG